MGDNGDAIYYMQEVIINLLNVIRLITTKFYLPRTEMEFQQHLPVVLQNTRLELIKPRGCASKEQRGGVAEIPSQEGVEHGTRLDLHVLGLSKNMDNPEVLRL